MLTTKPDEFEVNRHFYFQHKGYENDWEEMVRCFNYIVEENQCIPKLCTYGELTDLGYLGEESNAYTDRALNDYVYRFFTNMDLELTVDNAYYKADPEKIVHLEIQEHNWVFHKVKIQWLVNQYRTVGLYSPIQGRFKKLPKVSKQHKHHATNNLFIHPGMSRVHALRHLRAFDSSVVVWDPDDYVEKEGLTFTEWYSLFEDIKQGMFGTNVQGVALEMHVNEDRKDMYKAVRDIKINMYKHELPTLIGECETGIEKCFRRDGKEGVFVETKNDYVLKFTDLRFFLDLFPGQIELIDNERFKIYVK